ncbi:MAG: DNA mismatch repair protein MutS [Fibrobacterota bacterium]
MPEKKVTPMMNQYNRIKAENPGVMLLFRLGDFYEMFGEDAKIAANILGITLTKRNHGGGTDTPLAGFPHHALDRYAHKLVRAGYRIAVCEQTEDPKTAKGVVKRDVVEIVSAGTGMDDAYIEERSNNYILSLFPRKKKIAYALCDISTGEFYSDEIPADSLEEEITRVNPSEIVYPQNFAETQEYTQLAQTYPRVAYTPVDMARCTKKEAERILTGHFSVQSIESLGFEDRELSLIASAMLLGYLRDMKKSPLRHIVSIELGGTKNRAQLDSATIRNLEIIRPLHSDESGGTLISVLDKTVTVLGSRMLKRWLVRPLLNNTEIALRLDAVQWFKDSLFVCTDLRRQLRQISDLERGMTRVAMGRANARDIAGLGVSLHQFAPIQNILRDCPSRAVRTSLDALNGFDDLIRDIDQTLQKDPPNSLRDGGLIRDGVSAELDSYRDAAHNGKEWIAKLQQDERKKTGIDSLKIGFNKVFGYYIEVSRVNISKVPDSYMRKQTLANSERYITPELKEVEDTVLAAEEKLGDLEYSLFTALRERVSAYCEKMQRAANSIAAIDIFSTLGKLAMDNEYCRPEIMNTRDLYIEEGRHPVVEQMTEEPFVPNTTDFVEDKKQLFVITGPNMAGKSTYLRQNALIALMAQVGSFVPASRAKIGLVDRFFTRIGASDRLAKGQSTFMVEMIEVANILHNATDRSLVLLDEVGRGTSTFDGISIAWAVAEYIHNEKRRRARTLFATHYHELTELESLHERVYNLHISVTEHEGRVIFLRKIKEGSSSHSYGIEVASIAGLPRAVTDRSREIMHNLEGMEFDRENQPRLARGNLQSLSAAAEDRHDIQLDIFAEQNSGESAVEAALQDVDIHNITPLEALNTLSQLQSLL